MLFLPPLNCLLGVLCGTYFRVFIVLPLIAIAVLEAAAIGIIETGAWIAVGNSLVLIVCIEIGYVIGAALVYLFPVSALRNVRHNVRYHKHSATTPPS